MEESLAYVELYGGAGLLEWEGGGGVRKEGRKGDPAEALLAVH